MTAFRFVLPLAVLFVFAARSPAQFDPPAPHKPDEATQKSIAATMEKLEKALAELRNVLANNQTDYIRKKYLLAEVEIYRKAAVWIMRHSEFYDKDSAVWTLKTLWQGLERAELAIKGEAPWIGKPGRTVVHGFRSRTDDSFQPYAVTRPADYGKDPKKKYRLHVVLHGRDSSLTEVKFIHRFHNKPAPKDLDYIRIDVYGRGNVAYRWAGETDVVQARVAFATLEEKFLKVPKPEGRVLRGFSMGGAGTWHIGLHNPADWSVLGPGAGFTTTHGYIKGLPEKLPDYQEKCLRIYDAVNYAENAFNVPVVAYSGEKDAQKAAADNIEKRLRELKIPMAHLVAPGMAHQFPPEWQKKAEAEYARQMAKHNDDRRRIRFVTYSSRYGGTGWVVIEAMNRQYERTYVDAEKTAKGFTIRTENVRVLRLKGPFAEPTQKVRIDGQDVEVPAELITKLLDHTWFNLEFHDGRWRVVSFAQLLADRKRRPHKLPGLQGPIDDAFMESFLCVRGTGKPWHDATQKYAAANLERFSFEWNKFLRGDLPIKNDTDLTADDMSDKHLILFGDPSSNSLIAKVLDKLPLKWTKESITFAGKTVPAANHVPALIYPNPLKPYNYIVLNSGHTFHAADFRGTNALLYPRLGDYALLKLAPTAKDPLGVEVVTAGLFDDFWRIDAR